jgi:hypothetical protein
MKILQLIIQKKYFDLILSGEKTEEIREIKPTTWKKYVTVDEQGLIEDLVHYDALRLYVGYNKDRKTALVEVKDVLLEFMEDDEGKDIYYEVKGRQYQMMNVVYELGKVIER